MKLRLGANRRLPKTIRRGRYARVEALEPRCMLAAPTLGPLPTDVTVAAGAPLHVALDGYDSDGDSLTYSVSSTNPVLTGSIPSQDNPNGNRSMRISVDGYGEMEFELFEGRVPGATSRMIELAQTGWYADRIFHRILSGFMIQGGSRDGFGFNGSGVTFDDEFHPTLQHTSGGLLSMAKGGDDTNDSQFFITAATTRWLDFNHSIFGMLTAGDSVRQAIEAIPVDANGRPLNQAEIPVIDSVAIFQDTQNGVMMLSAPEGTTAEADVTVTVSDGQGGIAQQTIHVTILPDHLVDANHNALPYLGPIDSVWTSIDTPKSFNLDALDIEGDPVFYSAQVDSGAAYMDVSVSEAGQVTVTPKNGVFGIFDVTLRTGPSTASVGIQLNGRYDETRHDAQTINVFVRPPAPTLQLQPVSDTGDQDGITAINNTGGLQLRFMVSGVDPQATAELMIDGVPQETTELGRTPLGDGSGNDAVEVTLSTPLADEVYSITALQTFDLAEPLGQIAFDGEPSDPITVTVDTQPPVIVSQPVLEAFVGEEYMYQVSADDGPNNVLEYGLEGSKPDAMTIDPDTGTVSWTPQPSDPVSYQLVVVATDGAGNQGWREFELVVTNVAPMVSITGAPVTGPEGTEISLSAQVTDPDSDNFTYSWAVTKDGSPYATGSASGFTFTPDDGDADYVASLTVTDDDSAMGEAVPVTIPVTNLAPTIILGGSDTVAEGADYTLTLGAVTDPGIDTVTQWIVHWGDGLSDTYAGGGDPTHVYQNEGSDTVTVDLVDEDGTHTGAGSLDLTVTPAPPEVTDLGPIEFRLLEHSSLADGNLHFQIETTHEGFFTLQVDVPKPSKSARLKFYDVDPVENPGLAPLAETHLDNDGNQRIDWPVTAGETYYVEAYGDNADFHIRMANLLRHDASNSTVTVHGTDSNDTFEFDAAASRDVTINGVRYDFDDAQAESLTFNGGDGYDLVILDDSSGDDTLTAEAKHAVFSNSDQTPGFTVTVEGFEELQAYARSGGHDTAYLHDSDANDKFKSEPAENYAKMYGGRMYNRVKFYDVVEAFSSGEKDLARLFDTAGNDTFEGQQDVSWLRTDVFDVGVHNFRQVIAYALDGNDEATLKDSALMDEVYLKGHKSEIVDLETKGEIYKITARGFDFVHADGSQGAEYDRVKMWETPRDNHLEAAGNWAKLWAQKTELEMLYDVLAFEFVKVRASTGGNDTANVAEPLDFDLLFEDGWAG